jgi:pSer/pThr/pTyr-binding forkhead associated (FHA) protein
MADPIYQITVRSGPEPGKTFPLEREEVFMGRDLANDITISDPEVSRRHARFIMQDDNVMLEDLGSTNGTFLNGERISTPQQLRPGDVITLGENIVMVIEKSHYDPDATVVSATAAQPEEAQPQPSKQRSYQPPAEPAPYQQPRPAPQRTSEMKKGLPTWLIIMIIAIVVVACVIAVTLYFMPASWWCAITFDMLEGCPIQ